MMSMSTQDAGSKTVNGPKIRGIKGLLHLKEQPRVFNAWRARVNISAAEASVNVTTTNFDNKSTAFGCSAIVMMRSVMLCVFPDPAGHSSEKLVPNSELNRWRAKWSAGCVLIRSLATIGDGLHSGDPKI